MKNNIKPFTWDDRCELIREWVIDQYLSESILVCDDFPAIFIYKDIFEVTTKDIWESNHEGTLIFTYWWYLSALWNFGIRYADLNEPRRGKEWGSLEEYID